MATHIVQRQFSGEMITPQFRSRGSFYLASRSSTTTGKREKQKFALPHSVDGLRCHALRHIRVAFLSPSLPSLVSSVLDQANRNKDLHAFDTGCLERSQSVILNWKFGCDHVRTYRTVLLEIADVERAKILSHVVLPNESREHHCDNVFCKSH